jgi:hypothetical protein
MNRVSQHWPIRHILLWVALADLALWWRGGELLRFASPRIIPTSAGLFVPDFFQEWSSARNRLTGLPVYTPHAITLPRYLDRRFPEGDPWAVEVNAHPPTAILLALPLAGLSFPSAFLVWNLFSLAALVASLGLIARGLGWRYSPWVVLPLLALLVVCHPFWHQMIHGNLNLLLLALLTGTWAAARAGRPGLAGAALGTAAALKLFPAFLAVYFLARREGKVLKVAAATLAALTLLTAAILGTEAYRTYLGEVLPHTAERYRAAWFNLSLAGFWAKLFDPQTGDRGMHLTPLLASRPLAHAAFAASAILVAAVVARVAARARSRSAADLAFGLALLGMLLVSPITWEHYLLLLPLPLAVLWQRLPPLEGVRWVYGAAVVLLWLPPVGVMEHTMTLLGEEPKAGVGWSAGPVQAVTALSVHTWALLALFALGAALGLRKSVAGTLQALADGTPAVRQEESEGCVPVLFCPES